MKLEDIGFYTLSDYRASQISGSSPMWRCEMLVTDKCNFSCPYCQPLPEGAGGSIDINTAIMTLGTWAYDGLKNVRFSGGEPTLYKHLDSLVKICKEIHGVERIAISTNGSNKRSLYKKLIDSGVNDVSISLDACCASTADKMSNTKGKYSKVCDTIQMLTERGVYVTVGIVLNDDNINEVNKTIELAHNLGVADIRVISVAQENMSLIHKIDVKQEILDAHPILNYRVNNIESGRSVRGLTENDSPKCYLLQDDSIVAGEYHWPCIIYMRQQGKPIGRAHPSMREDRIKFFNSFNPHEDPICKSNCLDVCVDFNNKCHQLR